MLEENDNREWMWLGSEILLRVGRSGDFLACLSPATTVSVSRVDHCSFVPSRPGLVRVDPGLVREYGVVSLDEVPLRLDLI